MIFKMFILVDQVFPEVLDTESLSTFVKEKTDEMMKTMQQYLSVNIVGVEGNKKGGIGIKVIKRRDYQDEKRG